MQIRDRDKGFSLCFRCLHSLGEHNRKVKTGHEQKIHANRILVHPAWRTRTKENDIALIKLNTQARIDKYVKPACLPDKDAEVGSKCYITGKCLFYLRH